MSEYRQNTRRRIRAPEGPVRQRLWPRSAS